MESNLINLGDNYILITNAETVTVDVLIHHIKKNFGDNRTSGHLVAAIKALGYQAEIMDNSNIDALDYFEL